MLCTAHALVRIAVLAGLLATTEGCAPLLNSLCGERRVNFVTGECYADETEYSTGCYIGGCSPGDREISAVCNGCPCFFGIGPRKEICCHRNPPTSSTPNLPF